MGFSIHNVFTPILITLPTEIMIAQLVVRRDVASMDVSLNHSNEPELSVKGYMVMMT